MQHERSCWSSFSCRRHKRRFVFSVRPRTRALGPLTNATSTLGGLGVIGGLGYTPQALREVIHELKEDLNDKNAPFGVDLLLPKGKPT